MELTGTKWADFFCFQPPKTLPGENSVQPEFLVNCEGQPDQIFAVVCISRHIGTVTESDWCLC